jgi:hypothetical protein
MKMTLNMDAAKYVPGDCNSNWKRSEELYQDYEGETEVIDGEEYPVLPAGLMPW